MGGLACNGYLNTSTGIKYSGNFRFPASPKWKLLLPLPSESNLTHNTLATRPTDLLYKRNFGICWGSRKLENGDKNVGPRLETLVPMGYVRYAGRGR